MFQRPFATTVGGSLALYALLEITPANAATDDGAADHLVILELGAAGEREISEHTSHIGPAVGLEIEPIENWLEIELGASTNSSRGARNWIYCAFVLMPQQPMKKLPLGLSSVARYCPGQSWGGLLPRGNKSAVGRLGK
jgi:hypothetical protein